MIYSKLRNLRRDKKYEVFSVDRLPKVIKTENKNLKDAHLNTRELLLIKFCFSQETWRLPYFCCVWSPWCSVPHLTSTKDGSLIVSFMRGASSPLRFLEWIYLFFLKRKLKNATSYHEIQKYCQRFDFQRVCVEIWRAVIAL